MVETMEERYMNFLTLHKELQDLEKVEFIGVNYSENPATEMCLKGYYQTQRGEDNSLILEPLYKRNMVRVLDIVPDSVNQQCIRYEIALGNRTNDNMHWLYLWLSTIYPDLLKYKNELQELLTIKCTDMEEYAYSAMYFLGMIVNNQEDNQVDVKALKFHYLLRYCENPNRIGEKYVIDNKANLQMLRLIKIETLQKIVNLIEKFVAGSEMQVGIAAVDYFQDGVCKYKIYVKSKDRGLSQRKVLEKMERVFSEQGLFQLAKSISIHKEWLELHPELYMYGFALCLTNEGEWSVNLYH